MAAEDDPETETPEEATPESERDPEAVPVPVNESESESEGEGEGEGEGEDEDEDEGESEGEGEGEGVDVHGHEDEDEDEDEDGHEDGHEDEDAAAAAVPWHRAARAPAAIWVICAVVYCATLGPRLTQTSPDNHYSHLAQSWLDGRLDLGHDPPGTNDWACYDSVEHDLCPNNRWTFRDTERYRWYVSFPPFPAVVIAPAVALFGVDVPDRLYWALIAAFGPAFLFLLLRRLRPRSGRKPKEDLALTFLFAFGSVFFFVAVQGTVWFAAQCVAVPLIALYAYFSIDARRPMLAGLLLGCCFLTRPTTAFLCLFFALEALRVSRASVPVLDPEHPWWRKAWQWVRPVRIKPAARRAMLFAAPILALGALMMWMNHERFDDVFEFGHTYLQIRWRDRIERWGLFNYHFLGKNLAIYMGSLPWLSLESPHLMISRHGLALWVTTPALFLALWPRRLTSTIVAMWIAVIPVAILDLMYQNSGWIQFGYRFALDYLVFVFAIIALTRRRFGVGFAVLMAWSIAINTFGAVTFDRAGEFYNNDNSQNVIFQPD